MVPTDVARIFEWIGDGFVESWMAFINVLVVLHWVPSQSRESEVITVLNLSAWAAANAPQSP